MKMTITVDHNGKTYAAQPATLTRTSLGINHHGVMVAELRYNSNGSSGPISDYVLDAPLKDDQGHRRVGTAYGLDHIKTIIEAAAVDSWEELDGRAITVLHDGDSIYGTEVVGFVGPTGTVFIPKEHATKWREFEEGDAVDF